MTPAREIALVEKGVKPVGPDYLKALKIRARFDPHGAFLRLSPRIEKAIRKAARLHDGQIRKGERREITFVSHLLSVAELLASQTNDEDVLIAGLLHDSLEHGKPSYTRRTLRRDFGSRVARIVEGVAEREVGLNAGRRPSWRTLRRLTCLEPLNRASKDSLLVGCADKLHNFLSVWRAYQEQGAELWTRYATSPTDIVWFCGAVARLMRKKLKSPLAKELKELHVRMRKGIEEIQPRTP